MAAASPGGLGRPEAGVGAHGQLTAGAGAADPGGQLVDEAGGAAGGVGPPGPLAGVQHLAGLGAGGQQRVVAEPPGVAIGGALLVVAVDLADGGVQVDGGRPIARTGAGRPRPLKGQLGEPVELADVAEGEAAQEGPQRGGGHDPVAEHPCGGTTAQQVGVVDAVGPGNHRVDEGCELAAGVGRAWPLAEADELVGGLLDTKTLAEGGGQQQPGVGDGVGVVEGDVELVERVGGWHRKGALLSWSDGRLSNAILPAQRALFISRPRSDQFPIGGLRLRGHSGTARSWMRRGMIRLATGSCSNCPALGLSEAVGDGEELASAEVLLGVHR